MLIFPFHNFEHYTKELNYVVTVQQPSNAQKPTLYSENVSE